MSSQLLRTDFPTIPGTGVEEEISGLLEYSPVSSLHVIIQTVRLNTYIYVYKRERLTFQANNGVELAWKTKVWRC